jgi:hypothetical protein
VENNFLRRSFMSGQYLSTVSEDNSSTLLLANSGVFTGVREELSEYCSVQVSVFSDQAGTLTMEFSSDGTNYDVSSAVAITASIAKSYTLPVAGKYYRTKFTNSGGSTQTAFRLQTILSNRPAVFQDSDYLLSAGQLLPIKRTKANIASGTTDGSVVAAVTAKKIRVLAYTILAGAAATDVTFNTKPAGAGTAISCLHACGSNGGLVSGYCPSGHFQTSAGEGLSATTSAGGVATGINLIYVEAI